MPDEYGTTHYHIHKDGTRGPVCLGDFDVRSIAAAHVTLEQAERHDYSRRVVPLDYCIDVCQQREWERHLTNERGGGMA
jgi:hypothetical protein